MSAQEPFAADKPDPSAGLRVNTEQDRSVDRTVLPSQEPKLTPITTLAAPQLLGADHTITAHVEVPADSAEGVLACSGGELGGWALFLKEGKLQYVHNYLKLAEYAVSSDKVVPAGKDRLGIRFTPRERSEKPTYTVGDVTLLMDGEKAGEPKDVKMAGQYSSMTGYGLLIGRNTGTPVSHEYQAPFAFTGMIEKVMVELK